MCLIAGLRIAAIIIVGGAVLAAEGSEPSLLRFGVFDLDIKSGELRKGGVDVKLPPQPARVLVLLATRPGQLSLGKNSDSRSGAKKRSLTSSTA